MLPWLEIQNQIERYVERRKESEADFFKLRDSYLSLLQGELSENWELWKQRIAETKELHLVPDFDEAPCIKYPVDPSPPAAVVTATDGSQIFPSRHEIAPMALIHVSRIRIDYVNYRNPPLMESVPWILLREDFDDVVEGNREPTFEELVSDRRALEAKPRLNISLTGLDAEQGLH